MSHLRDTLIRFSYQIRYWPASCNHWFWNGVFLYQLPADLFLILLFVVPTVYPINMAAALVFDLYAVFDGGRGASVGSGF